MDSAGKVRYANLRGTALAPAWSGDIIFFYWNDENGQEGDSDHVGIVEKVEDGAVYTIEGNSGDMCQENRYTVGYFEILGYGTPAY